MSAIVTFNLILYHARTHTHTNTLHTTTRTTLYLLQNAFTVNSHIRGLLLALARRELAANSACVLAHVRPGACGYVRARACVCVCIREDE